MATADARIKRGPPSFVDVPDPPYWAGGGNTSYGKTGSRQGICHGEGDGRKSTTTTTKEKMTMVATTATVTKVTKASESRP